MAEHLPPGAVIARFGSSIFQIADPEPPKGVIAAELPLGSTDLDAHGVGWVVTHEHPLPFSRPSPVTMAKLAPRLTLLATFSPFRDGTAGLYEDLDAYYIPIAGSPASSARARWCASTGGSRRGESTIAQDVRIDHV